METPKLYRVKQGFDIFTRKGKTYNIIYKVLPGEYIFVVKSLKEGDWNGFSCLIMYKDYIGKKWFKWKWEEQVEPAY